MERLEIALIVLGAVMLILILPVLNFAGQLDDFTLNLWGKYLCYGILAIRIAMLWGYASAAVKRTPQCPDVKLRTHLRSQQRLRLVLARGTNP